jgi:threonine 3-dehydrogenase
MKGIQKIEAKSGAVLHDIPIPQIVDSNILVKIEATALCKSDVDVFEWTPLVASSNSNK